MSHPARGPIVVLTMGIDGKASGAGRRRDAVRVQHDSSEAAP